MQASIKILGDWNKEIGVSLQDALTVSMEVMGRTGEEACKHAIILMAQSARAITKTAPKNRKVLKDESGRYVENYVKGRKDAQKLYQWMFGGDGAYVPGTWDNARKIGNAGLAKRAWMWGLAKLKPGMHTGKAIPGASKVYSIIGKEWSGYIKENRLDYIIKALPAGWEAEVQMRAGNKIMAQARQKIERQWQSAMRRKERAAGMVLQQFFIRGLAA